MNALRTWQCSNDCGNCANPGNYNPSNPPLPCKDLCLLIEASCTHVIASGCLNNSKYLCNNNADCYSKINATASPLFPNTTQVVSNTSESTTGMSTTGQAMRTSECPTEEECIGICGEGNVKSCSCPEGNSPRLGGDDNIIKYLRGYLFCDTLQKKFSFLSLFYYENRASRFLFAFVDIFCDWAGNSTSFRFLILERYSI